ncbi:amidohydrolase [Cohnella endophytica]|uniref:Amidohydrolase n=1 Tax=Cohnella endophytica TaxID=2419778 RepID=A0A494XV06_9BACL|nr:M20 family metallopeptidase [Cohnella endophytica]RKP51393.1 amidohydrolase [Cohnella endophytica]
MVNVSSNSLLSDGLHLADRLIELRRDLHCYPELSFEEQRTSSIVASYLQSLGLSVRTNVGGYGVVADLHGETSGPVIALRADMDALSIEEETDLIFKSRVPGRMHACGHDAHTAILLGAAELLCNRREQLRGTVRLLFQSAEEINAGAKAMVEEGVLHGVKEIYGLHNLPTLSAGKLATRFGPMMGSVDRLEIVIEGKGGHGAIPDQAIDPIVAASAVVLGLQTAVSREISPFEPAVVTIGSFQGGEMNNVIPQRVRLTGTVRTFSPEVQRTIADKIERLVRLIAEGYRCTANVAYIAQVPVLMNDEQCLQAANQSIASLIGSDNLVEAAPTLAGEDFSVYLERIPGSFIWLGSGPKERSAAAYGLHHPKFEIDESCIPLGASVLASIAMDRLSSLY